MKHSIKLLLLIIIVLVSFSSCNKKKEIRVMGFAYKADKITLHTEHKNYLDIDVSEMEDKNRICSFSKKMKLYSKKNDIKIFIVLDSGNIRLLDTFISIPGKFKEPFITF